MKIITETIATKFVDVRPGQDFTLSSDPIDFSTKLFSSPFLPEGKLFMHRDGRIRELSPDTLVYVLKVTREES